MIFLADNESTLKNIEKKRGPVKSFPELYPVPWNLRRALTSISTQKFKSSCHNRVIVDR
jgi:hypothetical protein